MFRSTAAFLLIVAVLTANSSRFFIYAEFSLNQKEIAAKFCVNKNRPELHCNGKCYLLKKIKEAEDKEKSQEQQSQKNRFQEALVSQKLDLTCPPGFELTTCKAELSFNISNRSASIFHPPQA